MVPRVKTTLVKSQCSPANEGLLVFVQSTSCWQKVWECVLDNPHPLGKLARISSSANLEPTWLILLQDYCNLPQLLPAPIRRYAIPVHGFICSYHLCLCPPLQPSSQLAPQPYLQLYIHESIPFSQQCSAPSQSTCSLFISFQFQLSTTLGPRNVLLLSWWNLPSLCSICILHTIEIVYKTLLLGDSRELAVLRCLQQTALRFY